MLNLKNIYKINILLYLVCSNLECSNRLPSPEFLSDIISEYYSHLSNLAKQAITKDKPIGLNAADLRQAANRQTFRIQKLTACQERLLNAWGANDLDQLLVYLPKKLKERAYKAKVDFDTPVIDTRPPLERP